MKAEPIRTIPLENELTLQLFDRSRPVAADRWYIEILGEVAVSIHRISMEEAPTDLVEVVGDRVVFQQKRARHFIDEKDMEAARTEIIQSLTATLIPYLSHPDFAERLVRKTYIDTLNRRRRLQA